MIRIYSNESAILVNHVKNILDSEGIKAFIKNETMQGIGVGELGMCWPELWLIDDTQLKLAKPLIDTFLADSEINLKSWACEHCKEINDATFKLCWNCSQLSSEL